MRRAHRPLLAAILAVALGGCSTGQNPLRFDGYGSILEPQRRPAYFVVDVCSRQGPRTVTFTHVQPSRVAGTREPIGFRIAWPDGPGFPRVISGQRPVPEAYTSLRQGQGEVGACGKDPDRYAALAVLFPPTQGQPITVDGLSVTYEGDGHLYMAAVDVKLTQCPAGTHVTSGSDPATPCSDR